MLDQVAGLRRFDACPRALDLAFVAAGRSTAAQEPQPRALWKPSLPPVSSWCAKPARFRHRLRNGNAMLDVGVDRRPETHTIRKEIVPGPQEHLDWRPCPPRAPGQGTPQFQANREFCPAGSGRGLNSAPVAPDHPMLPWTGFRTARNRPAGLTLLRRDAQGRCSALEHGPKTLTR